MSINDIFGPDQAELDEITAANRVGARIRKIRLANNMSQGDLGEMVGLNGDRVQKYENGARKPKLDMIRKFATALGVNPLALTDPVSASDIGVMYALFEMEELYDLKITRMDNRLALIFGDGKRGGLNDYLIEWERMYCQVEKDVKSAGTKEECAKIIKNYNYWKWTFPDSIEYQAEQEQKERRKNEIKDQMEQLRKELSELEDDE